MRFHLSKYMKPWFEGQRSWRFVAALCAVFLVLGVLVRYSFLQDLDLRFTRELQEHPHPIISRAMLIVTFLGNATTLVGIAALVGAALWVKGFRRAAALLLVSLIGLPIDALLKAIWERARPDESLVNVAVRYSGTSFPSGHAMGGTMFYGAMAALAYTHLPKGWPRGVAVTVLVSLVLLIDLSRVYLGAHWFSDVVGGTAIGLALLIPLVKWYGERAPARREDSTAPKSARSA